MMSVRTFGLTISMVKTQLMAQDASHVLEISVGNHTLQVVNQFMSLGSFICVNLSLDKEIDRCTGKVTSTTTQLSKRV